MSLVMWGAETWAFWSPRSAKRTSGNLAWFAVPSCLQKSLLPLLYYRQFDSWYDSFFNSFGLLSSSHLFLHSLPCAFGSDPGPLALPKWLFASSFLWRVEHVTGVSMVYIYTAIYIYTCCCIRSKLNLFGWEKSIWIRWSSMHGWFSCSHFFINGVVTKEDPLRIQPKQHEHVLWNYYG